MQFLNNLQNADFFLMTNFVTYNNSLHAYWNAVYGNGSCCDGNDFPTNCSDPCKTSLRSFKIYGTQNNISEDNDISSDFLVNIITSKSLQEPTDYIDYSKPPLTVFNRTTSSSLVFRGNLWPVNKYKVLNMFIYSFILFHRVSYNCFVLTAAADGTQNVPDFLF